MTISLCFASGDDVRRRCSCWTQSGPSVVSAPRYAVHSALAQSGFESLASGAGWAATGTDVISRPGMLVQG